MTAVAITPCPDCGERSSEDYGNGRCFPCTKKRWAKLDHTAEAAARSAAERVVLRAVDHAEKVVSSYPDALGTTGKTTTLETAAQSGNGVSCPSPDRYAGRVVDLDALLAKPPEPLPWRVHD